MSRPASLPLILTLALCGPLPTRAADPPAPPPPPVTRITPVARIDGDPTFLPGTPLLLDAGNSVADPAGNLLWRWKGAGPAPRYVVMADPASGSPRYLMVLKTEATAYTFMVVARSRSALDTDADLFTATPAPVPPPAPPAPPTPPVPVPQPPVPPAPPRLPARFVTIATDFPPDLRSAALLRDPSLAASLRALGLQYRHSPRGSDDFAARKLAATGAVGSVTPEPDGTTLALPYLLIQGPRAGAGAPVLYAGTIPGDDTADLIAFVRKYATAGPDAGGN